MDDTFLGAAPIRERRLLGPSAYSGLCMNSAAPIRKQGLFETR